MPHSYCKLIYHLVFSTKGRRGWLDNEVRGRTHEYLGGAIREEGGTPLMVNGTSDHVHILAGLRQDKAVSDVLRNVKANSSGWIHRTFPNAAQFSWQPGYGAFTVSASQVDKALQYIAHQEEHHRQQSFEEEFVGLLKAHGVTFDPRYLWVES